MAIILPASLQSQNPDAAMLHGAPGVQLNGSAAPPSSAIFPDDLLQTPSNTEAKIDATGSTAVVAPQTLIQFEGNQLVLEHGTVQVTTSTQMTVRAGCITIIPNSASWTQYNVRDVDGKVTVTAERSDVNIEARKSALSQKPEGARSERATVREGEQASREEKCVAGIRPPDYVAGKTAWLNSWQAKVAATAAITPLVLCLGICWCDDPASPSSPSKCD